MLTARIGAVLRIRSRFWLLATLGLLPVLLLLALFIGSGLRGVDCGYHWDEAEFHMAPARHMVQTGVFLPQSYIYPSFDQWLVVLPSIPPGVRAALDTHGDPKSVQAAMLAAMDAAGYLLSVRSVFIVMSSLAILWVYGAALALRHKRWEALVAASGVALSWPYAYHSRWAVTDCILVQFSALTLFMLALFHRTRNPRWLYMAALAAGLGTGTKYTGVFLLGAVLLASCLDISRGSLFGRVQRLGALCALAFGAYLITTPATLLDPFRFLTDTHSISTYYLHGHGGYTATSGWDHARIVLTFFSLAYFSPSQWLALPLFVAVVAGGALWARKDWRLATILVAFPLFFLVMFCGRYRTVIIRNYLLLAPFLSLLMARGIADLAHWLRRPWLKGTLQAGLLAVFIGQAYWLVAAGESIRHVDPSADARHALEYVAQHPSEHFRVSGQVRTLAKQQNLTLPANVVEGPAGSHVVFFGRAEGPNSWTWKTNDPWLTEAVFGPREIDFNWYSSWSGYDRVVVMTLEKARETGVVLAL